MRRPTAGRRAGGWAAARAGQEAGFALITALVVVAALAAAALSLLARGEEARRRLDLGQERAQLHAYLDAAEALVIARLDADRRADLADTPADTPREAWAQSPFSYQIGGPDSGGRIDGAIRDLSGLFDLNALTLEGDSFSDTAFARLLAAQGLPESLGREIRAFLRGRVDARAYARRNPPVRPAGGPLVVLEQLRLVEGMTPAALARLHAVMAPAPGGGEAALNVNSAPASVLRATLPGLTEIEIADLIARRDQSPFDSRADFLAYLQTALGASRAEGLQAERFGVASTLMELTLTARQGTAWQSRRVIVQRTGAAGLARVALRQPLDARAALP